MRYHEDIPASEYNALATDFTANAYDPAAWATAAKNAGMRYMVLTTKHHDGFCLWDTATTDFNAAKTRARRDLVAEYVAACREAGLKVGLYFSIKDWNVPAYFRGAERDPEGWKQLVSLIHAQVRELMTNYGAIDILWYDGADDPNFDGVFTGDTWRATELNAMVRDLQPGILINDRCGGGDFGTPEQTIPSHAPKNNKP